MCNAMLRNIAQVPKPKDKPIRCWVLSSKIVCFYAKANFVVRIGLYEVRN